MVYFYVLLCHTCRSHCYPCWLYHQLLGCQIYHSQKIIIRTSSLRKVYPSCLKIARLKSIDETHRRTGIRLVNKRHLQSIINSAFSDRFYLLCTSNRLDSWKYPQIRIQHAVEDLQIGEVAICYILSYDAPHLFFEENICVKVNKQTKFICTY